jgi:hypothetical protein
MTFMTLSFAWPAEALGSAGGFDRATIGGGSDRLARADFFQPRPSWLKSAPISAT